MNVSCRRLREEIYGVATCSVSFGDIKSGMSNVALLLVVHSAYNAGCSSIIQSFSLNCMSRQVAWVRKSHDFSLVIFWAIYDSRRNLRSSWFLADRTLTHILFQVYNGKIIEKNGLICMVPFIMKV